MNNDIILQGKLRNIQFSHELNGTEYQKADLIVPRENGEEDVISLKFKKFANKFKEGDEINIRGNIRSHSQKLENGKNKVDIYVFTYFDLPGTDENGKQITNDLLLQGRICKLDTLRTTKNGKQNIHFIVANNIVTGDGKQKINNYIPCIAWGKEAKRIANMNVGDAVNLHGQLHSRVYVKKLENGEEEIKVAHEVVILEIEEL